MPNDEQDESVLPLFCRECGCMMTPFRDEAYSRKGYFIGFRCPRKNSLWTRLTGKYHDEVTRLFIETAKYDPLTGEKVL